MKRYKKGAGNYPLASGELQHPGVSQTASKWCKMVIKRRRPKCLTDLKTDVVAGKVFLVAVVEVAILVGAQKVALVVDKVVAKAKEQGESDSVNRV